MQAHTNTPAAQTERKFFTVTNNVTRETYNYVLTHPGCTRKQLIADMTGRGFKESSVSSLIAQMVTQGMVRGSAEGLHAVFTEYRPVKQSKAHKAAKPVKAAKAAPKPVQEEAKPPASTLAEKKAAIARSNEFVAPAKQWTAQEVLNGLSVLQARAVYDELKKIFGA